MTDETEGTPMPGAPVGAFDHGIEIRSAGVADVDVKQRLIDVIAVPYEQLATVMVKGRLWKEQFLRGAWDGIEKRSGAVRVNREHMIGDTVGKVVEFDPHHRAGLLARVKIAKTPRGDDTLELADDDMLSASVGYGAKPSDVLLDQRNGIRSVKRAILHHLAMVEDPAYEGAKVLEVRDLGLSSHKPELDSAAATPLLDGLMSDPVIRRALGLPDA
jgi:HK97 family phage prohead protease